LLQVHFNYISQVYVLLYICIANKTNLFHLMGRKYAGLRGNRRDGNRG